MSDVTIQAAVATPAFIIGVLCVIKRLAAFDLELRNYRAVARNRYLRTLQRGLLEPPEITGDPPSVKRAHDADFGPAGDSEWDRTIVGSCGLLVNARGETWTAHDTYDETPGPILASETQEDGKRLTHVRGRNCTEIPAWILRLLGPIGGGAVWNRMGCPSLRTHRR